MASYNADIRIGVVNSSALKKLQTQLTATQRTVDQLNQSLNFKAKATSAGRSQNAQLQKEVQSQTTLQRTVERRQQAEQKLARLQKNRYTAGLAQIQKQQSRVERLKRLEMRLEEQVTENYKRELAERDAAAARSAKKERRNKNLRAAGAGAGVAAVGIPGLGGVTGGALAGFAIGGPKGAVIGAAAAAVTELTAATVGFGAEAAKTTAAIELQRRALANTVVTQEEYVAALEAVDKLSKDFLIPLDEATQGFTKLNAAASASGFTVSEVEEVYRGLAAANVALGGDSERLRGILLATQQVFSKGKVQAEELRGQIGERLAGAFAKFAQSADLSTKDLDKALERGEVGLEDFVKFAKSLLEEYGENAQKLADDPNKAGERLKQSLTRLKLAVGPITKDIGRFFQDLAADAADGLAFIAEKVNQITLGATETALNNAIQDVRRFKQALKDAEAIPLFNPLRNQFIENAKIQLDQAEKSARRLQDKLNELRNPITASGKKQDNKQNTETKEETAEEKRERLKREQEAQRARDRLLAATLETDAAKELLKVREQIIQADLEGNKLKAIELRGVEEILRVNQQFAKETAKLDENNAIDAQTIQQKRLKAQLEIREIELKTVADLEKARRGLADDVLRQRAQEGEAINELLEKQEAIQQQVDNRLLAINNEIELLGAVNEEERERIRLRQELAAIAANSDFDDQQKQRLQAATINLASLKKEQAEYNKLLEAATPFANAFADSLTQGLRDVVAGTKSAEEAFADFLNNIADLLIQTAATMIAQYTAIAIARAFAGFPASPGAAAGSSVGKAGNKVGSFVNSIIPGLAEGGYVNRPTPALIGEGGEPEYVIPASKMSESMARYSAGNRGNSVVPNNATGGGNSPTSSGGAPLFDLKTTVINNVEYATVEDVRAMGAQATSAGAKQGEARVMSSLKNSRSMRSRVGI